MPAPDANQKRLAAARGLVAARVSNMTDLAVRTLHAEPAERGDVLVTLLVFVPALNIDQALGADQEKTHG